MTEADFKSSDYEAMLPYWEASTAFMSGASAVRAKKEVFLPKFANESTADYDFRLKHAKLTNVFRDIVEHLAAKPFAKEVEVESPSSELETFIEDVDGHQSHLHQFAAEWFLDGIANALSWCFVDYTRNVPQNASREQVRNLGARPYWRMIPAIDMIAAYSSNVGGKEVFYHVRFRDDRKIFRDGEEYHQKRIRIFNREPLAAADGTVIGYGQPTFEVWEYTIERGQSGTWKRTQQGTISLNAIPLVPLVIGIRHKKNSWIIEPAMESALDLQKELYQQESGVKYAKEATAFPMLAGNGVTPETNPDGTPKEIIVGPRSVLYAPSNGEGQHGEWRFIEPSAESLRFLADDVKETIAQLREIGRQPLTAQTGNLTVVTTMFAAQKGNSALQNWALTLKNALENAFVFTGQWLGSNEAPAVMVHTDFEVGMLDDKSVKELIEMRAAGEISQETFWRELKRRNVLSAEFDPDTERQRIIDEMPEEPSVDDEIIALTGQIAAE